MNARLVSAALLFALPACDSPDALGPDDMDFRRSDATPEAAPPIAAATTTEECNNALIAADADGLLPAPGLDDNGIAIITPELCESMSLPYTDALGNETTKGQVTCDWKFAGVAGLDPGDLEFVTWESDEGELLCGCACTKCRPPEEPPVTYDAIGDGSLGAPHEIFSHTQLADLSQSPDGWNRHFIQCEDIDLAEHYMSGGDEFMIGTDALAFSGSYDGRDHRLDRLTISSSFGQPAIGLFGRAHEASFRDLTMAEANVFSHGLADEPVEAWAGVLLGRGTVVSISGITIESGNVLAQGAGGLAGHLSQSSIEQSRVNVDIVGAERGGGLVGGTNHSTLSRVRATGSVSAAHQWEWGSAAGGLIGGDLGSTLADCEAHGDAGADEAFAFAGGLVGSSADTTIERCFSAGSVVGTVRAGGLLGTSRPPRIEWSYATGDTTCTGGENTLAGGLIGQWDPSPEGEYGYVHNCYASGDVLGGQIASGLMMNWEFPTFPTEPMIDNCYASGNVHSEGIGDFTLDVLRSSAFASSWGDGPWVTDSFSFGLATSDFPFEVYNFASWDVDPSNFYNEDQPTMSNPSATGQQPASGAAGHFANPNDPPLSMDWPEGPNGWDFSGPLPTIPSAGM